MDSSLRYFGCAVGFGFGVVWMTMGLGSAIVCVLLAGLGYGAVFVAERARDHTAGALEPVDRFELDDATDPLAAEAEYGWPLREPELAGAKGV